MKRRKRKQNIYYEVNYSPSKKGSCRYKLTLILQSCSRFVLWRYVSTNIPFRKQERFSIDLQRLFPSMYMKQPVEAKKLSLKFPVSWWANFVGTNKERLQLSGLLVWALYSTYYQRKKFLYLGFKRLLNLKYGFCN